MNYYELLRDIKDSPLTRAVLYPYGSYKFKKYTKEYFLSDNPEKIRRFKNIHRDERCFIVGNGPSLNALDLDKIQREYSFGANKIYNIYPNTIWRPTYYLCMDYMSLTEEISSEQDNIEAQFKFVNWQQHDRIKQTDNLFFCNFNPKFVVNFWDDKKVNFSEDCSKYIYNARTVSYSAIQLAVYMGFKEIYLIGMDANYPFYKDGRGHKHKTGAIEAHFKNGGYKRIDYMVKATNERGFQIAREYCEQHGIIIKNATRGGKLEVFERVDFDEVL